MNEEIYNMNEEIYSMDDFPKLIPDKNICFDLKDELKRSREVNFECSEQEFNCLRAAEDDIKNIHDDALIEEYKRLRLAPDTTLVMPDKHLLKHKKSQPLLFWSSVAAVAAAVAFMLIITNKSKTGLPVKVVDQTEISDIVSGFDVESTITNETENAQTPETAVEHISTKTDKTDKKGKKPAIKSKNTKIIESKVPELKQRTAMQQPPVTQSEIPVGTQTAQTEANITQYPETFHENRRENPKLERIVANAITVENNYRMNVVFVYERESDRDSNVPKPVYKVINGIAHLMENSHTVQNIKLFATNVSEARQNMSGILEGFKLTDVLGELTSDINTNKYFEEWISKHKDVAFEIHPNDSDESSVQEIYDANGNLIKAIFVTNKPVKYKNKTRILNKLNNK
ncbi:MAG: hypothetical protein LBR10_04220 [Prevotellaceae bacterium]|jgi:hypothetical protein|nr:hypothetical protein [Prevotellaceae bacterium]